MIRVLSIFFFFTVFLFASSQQVVFVLADDFSSKIAKLVQYEKIDGKFVQISKTFLVNVGKKGLAWGSGVQKFDTKLGEELKKEGDKKSPLGVFSLEKVYTYKDKLDTKMPYETSTKNHICVDDTNSKFYNKIIKTKDKSKYKSYENMLLKSNIYEYLITVNHNKLAKKGAGSCIFLHIQNPKKKATSGCTSMSKNKLLSLIKWLDIKKKPILIQSTKNTCTRFKDKYSFLNCDLK